MEVDPQEKDQSIVEITHILDNMSEVNVYMLHNALRGLIELTINKDGIEDNWVGKLTQKGIDYVESMPHKK